jgi:anti-sigma B factor antagonist
MADHMFAIGRRGGDAVVIAVSGELDLAETPALELELERVEASGATLVIVDLSDLEFIDSSGLIVVVGRTKEPVETAGASRW